MSSNITLQKLQSVEWGKSNLWNVKFADTPRTTPKLPAPFNEWFPATDISEGLAEVTSQAIPIYLSSYAIPFNTTELSISLTFVDDVNHSLCTWVSEWMRKIVNSEYDSKSNVGGVVETLEGSVKTLYVEKLNLDKTIYKLDTYYVFPSGNISFAGTSTGGVPSYTITFNIAGTLRVTNKAQYQHPSTKKSAITNARTGWSLDLLT